MMAGGAVQQNGLFVTPHHHGQQPHMEADPPDSRKRPLETPTEASSTKRTNTGGKRCARGRQRASDDWRMGWTLPAWPSEWRRFIMMPIITIIAELLNGAFYWLRDGNGTMRHDQGMWRRGGAEASPTPPGLIFSAEAPGRRNKWDVNK